MERTINKLNINYDASGSYYYPTIEQMKDGFRYQYINSLRNNNELIAFYTRNYIVGGNLEHIEILTKSSINKEEWYENKIKSGSIRAIKSESLIYVKKNKSYESYREDINRLLHSNGVILMRYCDYLLENRFDKGTGIPLGKNYNRVVLAKEDKLELLGVVNKDIKYNFIDKNLLFFYQIAKSDDNLTGVICSIPQPRFIVTLSNTSKEGYDYIIKELEAKIPYKGSRNLINIITEDYVNYINGKNEDLLNNNYYRVVSGGTKVDLLDYNPYKYCTNKGDVLFLIPDQKTKDCVQYELLLPYKLFFEDLEKIKVNSELRALNYKEVPEERHLKSKISSYTMKERVNQLKKYKHAT